MKNICPKGMSKPSLRLDNPHLGVLRQRGHGLAGMKQFRDSDLGDR